MSGGTARVVGGRYRLSGWLGRGGMGAVWEAHDTLLGRDVALKEIYLPEDDGGPADPGDPMIRRAFREARAAARLRHRGIVTIHDVVTEGGRPWIVMELIDGPSLAAAIRAEGKLPEHRVADIGLQVLDALRAAHRQGVLHRDVKPANILLDTDRVVLTDFGIAAIDDATSITSTGQMIGSPAFLAPERFNARPATAATDLWALGVTLYIAVTGRSPFPGDDLPGTLAAILHGSPEPPAEVGALWPVLDGLLAKDPADRLTADRAHRLLTAIIRNHGERPVTAVAGDADPRPELPPTLVAPSPTIAAPTAVVTPASAVGPVTPASAVGPAVTRLDTEPLPAEPPAPGPAAAEPTRATLPDDRSATTVRQVEGPPSAGADTTVAQVGSPPADGSPTDATGPATEIDPAAGRVPPGPTTAVDPGTAAGRSSTVDPGTAVGPVAGVDSGAAQSPAGPRHPVVVVGRPEPWSPSASGDAARRPFPWQPFWTIVLMISTLIAAGAIVRTAWLEWDRSSVPSTGDGSATPSGSPSPSVSPGAIPAAFFGEWSGTARQPIGVVSSWEVTITFTATSPTGGFDTSLSCDGTLKVVEPWPTDREIHLRQETGWNPRGTCVDAADVTLRIDDGRMQMSWQDLGEPLNVATASLTRS